VYSRHISNYAITIQCYVNNIQDLTKAEDIVQYHAEQNKPFVQLSSSWRDNILMPTEATAPMAAQLPINNLPIGK